MSDNVEVVLVFGSATNPNCQQWSDLDVCVIGESLRTLKTGGLRLDDSEYDFLAYESWDMLLDASMQSIQNVAKSIIESGVVVYIKE